ncbi:hypothetical protein [Streptomyces sp. NPDC051567]|uniref:hypothetical protein n=1 Tax=Streptomyces sp. NPDC051567 TaxID=3365660 RepID=UPI0037A36176
MTDSGPPQVTQPAGDTAPVPAPAHPPGGSSPREAGAGQVGEVAVPARARMAIRGRRSVNWVFASDRWAVGKARARVGGAVRGWGYRHPSDETLDRAVGLLVETAVAEGGKQLSLHVADQDRMLLVVALSHRAGAPGDDAVPARLAAVPGAISCGTDAAPDGRRLWVLLDTRPPPGPRDTSTA